eukprot:gene17779-21209_t
MKIKFFLLWFVGLIIFSADLHAQLILIQDKDGYTNMRNKPSKNGAVVSKITTGQIGMLREEFAPGHAVSEHWSWVGKGNYFSSDRLNWKYDPQPAEGYIHRSRYLLVQDLPALKSELVEGNSRSFGNDSLQVEIFQREFQASKHKIRTVNGSVDAIDDHFIWGTNGGLPLTETSEISVTVKGKKWQIPYQAIQDAYQPNLERCNVYMGPDGILYIFFKNP